MLFKNIFSQSLASLLTLWTQWALFVTEKSDCFEEQDISLAVCLLKLCCRYPIHNSRRNIFRILPIYSQTKMLTNRIFVPLISSFIPQSFHSFFSHPFLNQQVLTSSWSLLEMSSKLTFPRRVRTGKLGWKQISIHVFRRGEYYPQLPS